MKQEQIGKRVFHFAPRSVALLWFFAQHAMDHQRKVSIKRRNELRNRLWLILNVRHQQLTQTISLKGRPPNRCIIEGGSEAIHVCAKVDGTGMLNLLRCNVGRGSRHQTQCRQRILKHSVLGSSAGNSEVHQLDMTVFALDDVGRLPITFDLSVEKQCFLIAVGKYAGNGDVA